MIKTLTLKALASLAIGAATTHATYAQSTLASPLTEAQAAAIATQLTADAPTSDTLYIKAKFHTYGAKLDATSNTLLDSTFVVGTTHRFVVQSATIARTIAQGDMTRFDNEWTLKGVFQRNEATGEVRFLARGLYNAIYLTIEKYAPLYLRATYVIPEGLEVSGITGSANASSRGLYFTWQTAGKSVNAGTATLVRAEQAGTYMLPLHSEAGTAAFTSNTLRGSGEVGWANGVRDRYTYAFVNTADSLGFARSETAQYRDSIYLNTPYAVFAAIGRAVVTQYLKRPESEGSTQTYLKFPSDLVTSIGRVATAATPSNTAVYDLNGRQVGTSSTFDQLPSGIYLVAGKKVVK